jgi:hypothetical protein
MSEKTAKLVLTVYLVVMLSLLACGVAWMLVEHQPCLKLYGVGSPHDSTDLFLDCIDDNMGRTYVVIAGALILWAVGKVLLHAVNRATR